MQLCESFRFVEDVRLTLQHVEDFHGKDNAVGVPTSSLVTLLPVRIARFNGRKIAEALQLTTDSRSRVFSSKDEK